MKFKFYILFILFYTPHILHAHNTLCVQNNINFQSNKIYILLIPFLLILLLLIFSFLFIIKKKNIHIEKKEKEIKSQEEIIRTNAMLLLKNTQELLSLNTQKDKFYSIISHDLRNYVSTIKGFSDLIVVNQNTIHDEKKEYYISMISKTADSTMNLLNNLLEWSRSQQGKIMYNPEIIDLHEIASDVINNISPFAEKKAIKIINKKNPNIFVFGDKGMIFTILRNLLSNAIKFTNSGGSVTLFTKKENDKLIVHVKDTGVGIAKENITKLFVKEVIYSTLGTEEEIGSGIGLMLCKEFIEAHNQEIGVKSTLGEGSDFWFTLKYEI